MDGDVDLMQRLEHFVCVCEAGRIVWINRAGLELLRADDGEAVLGSEIGSHIPEDFVDLFSGGLDLMAGEAEGAPIRVQALDGTVIDVLMFVSRLPGHGGQRYLVECQDITDLIQAARAAQDREYRITAILQAVDQAIIVLDETGVIKDVNDVAMKVFGYAKREMVGRNMTLLMHELHHDAFLAPFNAAPGAAAEVREVEGRRADGGVFPIELTVVELKGEARRKLFVSGVRDISQRKRAEREAHRAMRLKAVGHLAQGIAHEINSPAQFIGDNLRFVDASVEALLKVVESQAAVIQAAVNGGSLEEPLAAYQALSDEQDLEMLIEDVRDANRQSLLGMRNISDLIVAMKEFSFPASKERASVDVNRVVKRTAAVSRNDWKDIAELVFDLDPILPSPCAWEEELNHAMLALVVNAAQAIAEKPGRVARGRIAITTACEGDDVVIRVEDDGKGIARNIRGLIFNPFFSTREVGKGTGQGLSLAYDIIVTKHGGAIDYESEEGRGTTFTVRLPLPEEERQMAIEGATV